MEDRDTKGDLYEYMLGKLSQAGDSGQFRTPRHIIRMMVEIMQPKPTDIICDPACGTAGFLVSVVEHFNQPEKLKLFNDETFRQHFHNNMFHGLDFDSTMLRIGSMNMLLHGVENPGIVNRDSVSKPSPTWVFLYASFWFARSMHFRHQTFMRNLSDYYTDLLNWEEAAQAQLVHEWPVELRQAVETDIVLAVRASGVKGTRAPIRPGSTNQSIGNQVAEYTTSALKLHTSTFSIGPCPGAGYPDKTIMERSTQLKIPLEIKATSDWNPMDSNRRVLTSSSAKLRNQFRSSIHHLLLTILYSPTTSHATIGAIRLDFLEPTTTVNVRLEASVNHKILALGLHHTKVI